MKSDYFVVIANSAQKWKWKWTFFYFDDYYKMQTPSDIEQSIP